MIAPGRTLLCAFIPPLPAYATGLRTFSISLSTVHGLYASILPFSGILSPCMVRNHEPPLACPGRDEKGRTHPLPSLIVFRTWDVAVLLMPGMPPMCWVMKRNRSSLDVNHASTSSSLPPVVTWIVRTSGSRAISSAIWPALARSTLSVTNAIVENPTRLASGMAVIRIIRADRSRLNLLRTVGSETPTWRAISTFVVRPSCCRTRMICRSTASNSQDICPSLLPFFVSISPISDDKSRKLAETLLNIAICPQFSCWR